MAFFHRADSLPTPLKYLSFARVIEVGSRTDKYAEKYPLRALRVSVVNVGHWIPAYVGMTVAG